MKVTVLTAVLVAAATGAMAAPPAEAPVPVEQAASAPSAETNAGPGDAAEQKEKKICRTERATGSLTRRTRICMTEAQWREVNADTRRGMDDMTRDRVGGGTTSNN
jgi:hypothetical protein